MNNLCRLNTEQNPAGAFQIKSESNLYLAGTNLVHTSSTKTYNHKVIQISIIILFFFG